jgi:hypothetical protein
MGTFGTVTAIQRGSTRCSHFGELRSKRIDVVTVEIFADYGRQDGESYESGSTI